MLLRPSKANKLDVQWEGPAEVVRKLSDTNYAVKIVGRREEVKVYHVNLMKPYLESQAVVCISLNSYEEMPIEFPVFREHDRSEATSAEMRKMIKDVNLTGDQVRDEEPDPRVQRSVLR